MSLDSTIQQDELSKESKPSVSPVKQISTNNYSINPPAEQDSCEESDEILIVEVQLGQNVKTQLQIARS